MNKKIAVLQSNYIPWKGYFDLINFVDEFIIYDCVQYTKNDWRNRNIIKTQNGTLWLTIPVEQKKLSQTIYETKVFNKNCFKKHLNSIVINYAKAKCFNEYHEFLKYLYLDIKSEYLSIINLRFILEINKILGIDTKISSVNDYNLIEGKTERLVNICQQVGAKEYVTGPAAKNYLNEQLFHEAKIKVSIMNYSNYPEYNQIFPPFIHNVSILDVILNEGKNAKQYLKSFI